MAILYIAAVAYAASQVLGGYGARKMSDLWFLVTGVVSVVIWSIFLFTYQRLQNQPLGELTPLGFLYVFLSNAGIAVFILSIGRSFKEFDASFVIPFVFGLAILLATITGYILSRNIPTVSEIISILLISGGLILYAVNSKHSI